MSFLSKLRDVPVLSNRRVTGDGTPMVTTTPAPGQIMLSVEFAQILKLRAADFVYFSQFDSPISQNLVNLEPTGTDAGGNPVHYYVAASPEAVSGNPRVGNKLQPIGTRLAFSSVGPWANLGGNTEEKSIYKATKAYGFGVIEDGDSFTVELITNDTPNDTAFDEVIVMVCDPISGESEHQAVDSVEEAKTLPPFMVLTFVEKVNKQVRTAGDDDEEEAAAPATTSGKKGKKQPVEVEPESAYAETEA
jgi:hypothetical protein